MAIRPALSPRSQSKFNLLPRVMIETANQQSNFTSGRNWSFMLWSYTTTGFILQRRINSIVLLSLTRTNLVRYHQPANQKYKPQSAKQFHIDALLIRAVHQNRGNFSTIGKEMKLFDANAAVQSKSASK